MKRIYTALSIAALVLAAGSCEKNLDIPQKSVLSTEDYYTNASAEDAEEPTWLVSGSRPGYFVKVNQSSRET